MDKESSSINSSGTNQNGSQTDEDIDGGMSAAEEDIRGFGPFLLTLSLFLVSVTLLILTPSLTKAPPPNMGYHTHPAFFPVLTLLVIAIGSGLVTVRCLLRSWPLHFGQFIHSLVKYGKLPALYAALYLGYFYLVTLIGYLPATLLFVAVCLAIAKLERRQWLLGTLALPAICYIVFIYFFEIWFPSPSLF